MIKERIQELMSQVQQMQAQSAEQMEALRIKYLSKKGEITELFNQFREVPKEEKKELGMQLNALRQMAESRLQEMREALEAQRAAEDKPDLTRTPEPIALGTRHPLSLTKEEIGTRSGGRQARVRHVELRARTSRA